MRKWLSILALVGATFGAAAGPVRADEGVRLDRAPDYTDNLASLQHGAQLFVNYCLNCHGASLMRYSKLESIGISQKEIEANLLFAGEKVGDTMTVAMRPADAKEWFGVAPPDLSVESRARGADWLYTYLRTFYRDPTRPTGWNNLVFPNVGMPHVLWQLQGMRDAKFIDEKGENGEVTHQFAGFKQVSQGTLAPVDYDASVADLVSYLSWMAEPAEKTRKRVGVWVLLFLGVLTLCAWRLNAAYWKDIK
jgi:ubiquinol-cytochrome c reductase cytochrome c1 subunit